MEDNTNNKSLKECALEYVNNGFALVPIAEKQKTKYLLKWGEKQIKTADEVESWWNECPNYNIAIVTGKLSKNLLVIDVDMKNDKNGMEALEKWAESHEKIKCNAIATTPSGGYHYYFYVPDELLDEARDIKTIADIYEGVDIRYNGGVIDAPPSYLDYEDKKGRHEGAYTWLVGGMDKIAPLDKNVLEFITEGMKRSERNKESPATAIKDQVGHVRFEPQQVVYEGTRNDSLTRLCGMLQAQGKSDTTIYQEAYAFNSSFKDIAGKPCPLDKKEADNVIKSVIKRYPKGNIKLNAVSRMVKNKVSGLSNDYLNELNDTGFARIFSFVYKDVFIYVSERKEWYFYNGKYWEEEKGGEKATLYATYMGDGLLSYAYDLEGDNDKKSRKHALINAFKSLRKTANIANMLKLAKGMCNESYSTFNKDANLLNMRNGTFDLEKMELRGFSPSDHLTMIANAEYHKGAKCELWDKVVRDTLEGDQSKADFIQMFFGTCLTTDISQECAFALKGVTRAGKTTLLTTIATLLGCASSGYADTLKPESLTLSQRGSESASPEIAKLEGKRMVYIPEPSNQMVLDSALLKQLVGGSYITARRLYGNPTTFKPSFKLVIDTNHYMTVTDSTIFTGRKIWFVLFNKTIKEKDIDPSIKPRLIENESLSGIFNWCLEGLRKYRANGNKLLIPEVVRNDTREFAHSSDKVQCFIDEALVYEAGSYGNGTYIALAFREYCEQGGYKQMSDRAFYENMKAHGINIVRKNIGGKDCKKALDGYVLRNPFEWDSVTCNPSLLQYPPYGASEATS